MEKGREEGKKRFLQVTCEIIQAMKAVYAIVNIILLQAFTLVL